MSSRLLLAQGLTVQVGDPPPPSGNVTNTLVAHGDVWHWRAGTSEPQAGWATAADLALDGTWASAPGGFGYGDPGIVGEATTVSGMNGVYSSFYIRRTFTVGAGLDTNALLLLTADFDDGFVAYLDGVELARENVAGAAGGAVAFDALATGSHEASCCTAPTTPATNRVFGAIGPRLAPGDHVLAVHGLNRAVVNGDFHLITDLRAVVLSGTNPPPVQVQSFPGYAISTTNLVTLRGSNTLAGTVRVTVNGDDAAFDAVAGTWSRTQALRPGWNALFIAAHDAAGQIVGSVEQTVIHEVSAVSLGGTLSADASYLTPGTVVRVNPALVVPAGVTLDIGGGVVVLTAAGQGITAQNGGRIRVQGEADRRAYFTTEGGTNAIWGPLSATGTNSALEVRFADVSRSQINATFGATGLIEDAELHDFDNPSGGTLGRPLMMCNFAASFVVRRTHFTRYYENLVRNGVIQVEDCLFEHMNGDALDFDAAQPGSFTRRCTYRHGNLGNVDAVDIGPGDIPGSTDTVIESCLMWDFPFDKGVSIGDNGSSQGIVVTNCLIYGCDSGVAVKDSCSAIIANCTLVNNDYGINLKAKFPGTPPGIGGHVSNSFNNLIWGNTNFAIWVTNGATIEVSYTDISGTNWPGIGNFSADPLFLNAAAHDYRLSPGSPAIGSGLGGATLGVRFPVGGIGRPPLRLVAVSPTTNAVTLAWTDDTENEDGVIVERSLDGVAWARVAVTPANATSHTDTGLAEGTTYAYRVRTTNWSGVSPAGNVAKATTTSNITVVGGALAADTTWGGTVIVASTVSVPGPLRLVVLPGTQVLLTNGAGVTATGGGSIDVQGTAGQPVVFGRGATTFTRWGDLAATGAGSTITIRHAQITRGRVRANSGGTALVEDSELSDIATTGIIGGSSGALFTVRRCYVHDYEDIDLINTRTVAEDSLFERANSDIFELQSSPEGSVLRRCTFRACLNPNSDGIDMNGCRGVRIESCLVHDVTDKGISSGSASSASDPTSFGLVVTNTLVYDAAIGLAVKDNGTASVFGSTFAAVTEGISAYGKFTAFGGHVTNRNNLFWDVTTALALTNDATALVEYCDFQQTNFPGSGNFSADPLWRDPSASARDYRVLPGSPTLGAGADGANVGAAFAVGAPMAPSHPEIQSVARLGDSVELVFWTDSGRDHVLEVSSGLEAPAWHSAVELPSEARPRLHRILLAAPADGARFYRLGRR